MMTRTKIVSLLSTASLLSLILASAPATSQAATVTPFVTAVGSWPPLAVLNPFSPNSVPNPDGLVNASLAYFVNGDHAFVPELAASWSIHKPANVANNATITLHLRKNAQWSNGAPMTARDVKTSLDLGFIFGYQVNGYIQSITTPNASTVVVRQNAKPFNLFVRDLLTSVIYPAAQWGRYIPSNVVSLYHASEGTGTAASSAATKLATIAKKIAGVRVSKYIAGGPYNYSHITSDEIVLTKNPNWWGAKNVHVPVVDILASSGNSEFYSYALSGRTDLMSTFAPPTVINPFVARHGNHLIA